MTDAATSSTGQSARNIFRNARSLVSGKALAGVLSLAYLAIAARSLGPSDMGVLVLVHAYAMVIAGLARFQSWQAVIRFGSPMLASGDDATLKSLLRYTIRLDLLSGVVSVLASVAVASFAGKLMGWSDDVLRLVYINSIAVPFMITATPTGVLRLFDQFRTLGWQITIMPITRFVGAITLWVVDGGLNAFIVLWIASLLLDGASLWFFGLRALRARNLMPALTGKAERRADPAWLPFMIKTNLSSSLEMTHLLAPLLIVGAVLGSGAAGFLKIAQNLANVLAQPIQMLNHAIFPELSKVEVGAGRKQMLRVCLRAIAIAVAVSAPIVLLFTIFRRELATLVGGPEFLDAAPLIALMALVQPLTIASLALSSAVLARGRAGWELSGQIIGAIVHFGLLMILLSAVGVIAAPLALMANFLVLIIVLVIGAVK